MGQDLLERDDELATFAARLRDAQLGEGGALVLQSSAGTGKTSLLRRLRTEAEAAGFRVLPATGGELDREFPFGLVRQLFEPALLAAGQDERARLLSGAAARAAPIVGGEAIAQEPSADASFAVLHGLYWLTAALAEADPLLLVVDDAHWGDAPSLRFLEFLARRAGELRVLVAVGTRQDEPGAEEALLSALTAGPAADVVHPAALSAGAVRSIVTAGLGDAGDDVVASAVRTTGGNPLLVAELVRELAAADGAPSVSDVEAVVPSSIARAAQRRLARLDPVGQAAARALAVLGDGTPADLLAAATERPAAEVDDALDRLRRSGMVEDVPPRFAHPLLRSAIAAAVPDRAAAALHHTAARALHAAGETGGALVVHLLAAPPLGEPWAAETLRASARDAAASGAPDAGLRQLRRAREELAPTADATTLAAIDLELAQLAVSSGEPEANAFLARAMAAPDERFRAEAGMFGVSNAMIQDDPGIREVIELVRAALANVAHDDPDYARMTSALMSAVSMMPHHRAERDALHDEHAGETDHRLRAYEAWTKLGRGVDAATVEAIARDALAEGPMRVLEHIEHPVPLLAVESLISCDEAEVSLATLRDGEATARRHGSRHGMAMVMIGRADWHLSFGSLATAEADAAEARARFSELGMDLTGMSVWSAQADALIERGRLDEAAALLAAVPGLDTDPAPFGIGSLWLARARLRLAQGRPDEALRELDAVDRWGEDFGWRRWPRSHPEPLRCAAAIATGDADAVAWGLERADAAGRDGFRRLQAELLLAAATGDHGDVALERLEAAAEVAATVPVPLVQAKVAYARGMVLRRAGRRVEAREHLTEARALATTVSADALAERAAEELIVAGGRPRRIATSGVDALTPSERRVAEHAARGLSNREIAETLFVTRKTVETTLGHAYAKLDIRSRTQLPAALGLDAAAA